MRTKTIPANPAIAWPIEINLTIYGLEATVTYGSRVHVSVHFRDPNDRTLPRTFTRRTQANQTVSPSNAIGWAKFAYKEVYP